MKKLHLVESLLAMILVGCNGTSSSSSKKYFNILFQSTQTKGLVRLTILEIARTTTFHATDLQNMNSPSPTFIPGFKLVFMTEYLGNQEILGGNGSGGPSPVYINSHQVNPIYPPNLVPSQHTHYSAYNDFKWEHLTKMPTENPNRTTIIESWYNGEHALSNKLDIHITSGFNGKTETFIFNDIAF